MTVSTVPPPTNLEIMRGDGLEIPGTLNNPDGSAFDFTGYTGAADVKRNPSDAEAAFSFDVTLGDDGAVTLALAGTDTENASGDYVWDLQITNGGEPLTIARGNLKVVPDVTP